MLRKTILFSILFIAHCVAHVAPYDNNYIEASNGRRHREAINKRRHSRLRSRLRHRISRIDNLDYAENDTIKPEPEEEPINTRDELAAKDEGLPDIPDGEIELLPDKLDAEEVATIHGETYGSLEKGPINGDINNVKGDNDNTEECFFVKMSRKFNSDLEAIEKQHEKIRADYDNQFTTNNFDKKVLDDIVQNRGVPVRAITAHNGIEEIIPAGINLGGDGILVLPTSVLFFHRLKLIENTIFRINNIKNDVTHLVMHANLSLNDLIVQGTYDRLITNKDDRSLLFYSPTLGELRIHLTEVNYITEARYRVLENRLQVVHIVSVINCKNVRATYGNMSDACGINSVDLDQQHIADILRRIKRDLNHWLKDFFNDYLAKAHDWDINFAELQKFDADRLITLNKNTDELIQKMVKYTQDTKMSSRKLPKFKLFTVAGAEMDLHNGVVSGTDTMFRRSLATCRVDGDARYVDAMIGFGNLKVKYEYAVNTNTGMPKLHGEFILSGNDMTVHMHTAVMKNPDTLDVDFDYFQQITPRSLVVEGPLLRVVGNMLHVVQHHLFSIMSNLLLQTVKNLEIVTKCDNKTKVVSEDAGTDILDVCVYSNKPSLACPI